MANLSINKKYHFLYKTTNLINGKVYYGMHSTNNLEDGYLGSGVYFRQSVKKHGKENFKREILEFFENREELIKSEKALVTEDFCKDKNCMNLRPGGSGGFINEGHQLKCAKAGKEKYLEKLKNDPEFKKAMSEKFKKSNKEKPRGCVINNVTKLKKKIDMSNEELKKFNLMHEKSKVTKKIRGTDKLFGSKNGSFGAKWMNNGIEVKRVTNDQINLRLEEGWIFGKVFLKDRRVKSIRVGKDNPCYGMIWITNGINVLKIKKERYKEFELQGFRKGRK